MSEKKDPLSQRDAKGGARGVADVEKGEQGWNATVSAADWARSNRRRSTWLPDPDSSDWISSLRLGLLSVDELTRTSE